MAPLKIKKVVPAIENLRNREQDEMVLALHCIAVKTPLPDGIGSSKSFEEGQIDGFAS